MFWCKHFENIIKDLISLNECCINITRRLLVRTLPERSYSTWTCFLDTNTYILLIPGGIFNAKQIHIRWSLHTDRDICEWGGDYI